MQPDLASDLLAGHVARYLDRHPNQQRLFRATAPLLRPVEVRPASWHRWLTQGGRPGTASYVGPLDSTRVAAARNATRGLAENEGNITIDREHLVALSAKAARGAEKACLSLWVATMMWGSGTTNGRGPWRTAGGLAHDGLADALVASHRTLRSGDLEMAHVEASAIFGSGQAFFTRWLWAASLGLPRLDGPVPVILDERRRDCLSSILDAAGAWECLIGYGRRDYVAYATTLTRAADLLRREHRLSGATAEKIEWLLAEGAIAPVDYLRWEDTVAGGRYL